MGAKAKYSRPRVAIDPEVCLPRAPNSSAENFLSGFFTHPTHLRAALNGAGRNGERREEEGEKMGVEKLGSIVREKEKALEVIQRQILLVKHSAPTDKRLLHPCALQKRDATRGAACACEQAAGLGEEHGAASEHHERRRAAAHHPRAAGRADARGGEVPRAQGGRGKRDRDEPWQHEGAEGAGARRYRAAG
eukprot:3756080-Rhodomonas_salina.1